MTSPTSASAARPVVGFSWRCALGFHRWLMWGEVTKKRTTTYAQSDRLTGAFQRFDPPIEMLTDVQIRACARCGLLESRKVKSNA